MTKIKKGWLAGVVAVGVCLPVLAAAGDAVEVGEPAPNFALKTLGGENLRLSEYRGRVVLVNFWASWCGPCREQLPALQELHDRYERAGLKVLAVNVEEDRGEAVAAAGGYTFPVLLDAEHRVSRRYDIGSMPVTLLIDRDGVLRYAHRGKRGSDNRDYREELRGLLRE
jgi:peroxiredoxin